LAIDSREHINLVVCIGFEDFIDTKDSYFKVFVVRMTHGPDSSWDRTFPGWGRNSYPN
jgi:hypothetical protein